MADEPVVEKRKRGRPRKGEVVIKPPKKKVGRPKKVPPTLMESESKKRGYKKTKTPTVDDIIRNGLEKQEARRYGKTVEDLTPRDKAAIIYGIVYNTDATQLLLWAIARDTDSINPESKKTSANLWYNSGPVVIFRNQFLAQYEKSIKEKIDAALAIQKEQLIAKFGGIDPSDTDYTNPEAQRKLLNHLINTAGDGKEKLDALKTIVSMQKDDREAAKDNKVQRFYMPLKCTQCPLHARAEKRRERMAREKAALEAAKLAAEEAGVEFIAPDDNDLLKDDDSFLEETPGDLLPDEGE